MLKGITSQRNLSRSTVSIAVMRNTWLTNAVFAWKERAHTEKTEIKEENDSDSDVPPLLVSPDKDENESKDLEPKDEKDKKQNTEEDETIIGAVATLKPKLHLDVTLTDTIFKKLEPKMPLTPPTGFDVKLFLKAFENSIDICNNFNTLQTVDLLPPPLISPKEVSITTTSSTRTTLVVPAPLPKRPVAVMHKAPRVMCPRAWQMKAM